MVVRVFRNWIRHIVRWGVVVCILHRCFDTLVTVGCVFWGWFAGLLAVQKFWVCFAFGVMGRRFLLVWVHTNLEVLGCVA